MIPQLFIEQWRTQAPWQTLAMVEQDLIISRALIELYHHPIVQSSLVFRGGTALNKLYINPPTRYSEDIDLVQIRAEPIGGILDAIRNKLDGWLGEPKRKLTERSAKLIYKYQAIDGSFAKLKIEINTTEHFHIMPLVSKAHQIDSEWFHGMANILTYELEELMGTKLRALYQRRKGRDLFDLWYVASQSALDVKKSVSIFTHYCKHNDEWISQDQFKDNLAIKKMHQDFQVDIKPLLIPDVKWDFEEAYSLVNELYINNISTTQLVD